MRRVNVYESYLPELSFEKPVRVLFIRHGCSEANAKGILQGNADSELSAKGLAQARALGRALAGETLNAVYCSTLTRARRTAEEVAAFHPPLVPVADARLREIDSGVLEGRTFEDNHRDYAELFQTLYTHMAAFDPPQGESTRAVFERALDFVGEVLPRHQGETIAVVCHGFLLATLIHYFTGEPFDTVRHDIFENTSVSEIICHGLRDFDAVRLNDYEHLTALSEMI